MLVPCGEREPDIQGLELKSASSLEAAASRVQHLIAKKKRSQRYVKPLGRMKD